MWQTDWTWGLAGGLMIGSAASILLLFNGRIMGASGIIGGLIDGTGRSNLMERLAFVTALIAVPALAVLLFGAPATNAPHSLLLMATAGLLVGIGTRVGSGCTSGHGVCGMSRLSRRSIVATLVYLTSGGLTILLTNHIPDLF